MAVVVRQGLEQILLEKGNVYEKESILIGNVYEKESILVGSVVKREVYRTFIRQKNPPPFNL